MSTQSNAVPDAPLESQAVASVPMSPTRPLYWSVRRELWEYRAIYIAPLALAAVALISFFVRALTLPNKMHALSALDPAKQREALEQPYIFATALIMGATFIVGLFYCLDALHGERRDRSILFWKSLPVSDLTTVLAKASVPLVILPVLTLAITFAAHWIMLLVNAIALVGSGYSTAALWTPGSLFQMEAMLFYHMVSVHVLWYAPIYCFLLLISAWAKRVPLLWAVLPPIGIYLFEKIVFNTTHFCNFLRYRLSGPETYSMALPDDMRMDPLVALSPGKFLSTPGLWIGLVAAALLLAAAVRLRRYREPI